MIGRGDLFAELNEAQREAASYHGHCLVTACPGSGKTKMLSVKAASLIQQGNTVLAVTFTRDSAQEIAHRVLSTAGMECKSRFLAGTFHKLCFLQQSQMSTNSGQLILADMRRPNRAALSNIATDGDVTLFVQRAVDQSGIIDLDVFDAKRIIEAVKCNPNATGITSEHRHLYQLYQDIIRRNHKIDFQDIIVNAVNGMEAGEIPPYPADVMLVDEYQDTDELQLRWIMLHAGGSKITVVGDEDQSIYGFRRALGFAGMERFVRSSVGYRVVLGDNYRCRSEILAAADNLIRHNQERSPKQLRAAKGPGGKVYGWQVADRDSEAVAACLYAQQALRENASVAILSRTNRLLDAIEGVCAVYGVPYLRPGGGSVFDRPEISLFADVLNLTLGKSQASVDAALAWANVPESDLAVLHREMGADITLGARGQLAKVGVAESSKQAWRELAKKVEIWRRHANDMPGITIQGIADYLRSCRADDKRSASNIELATLIFDTAAGDLGVRVTLLKNMRRKKKETAGQAVVLTTMHGSKGLEWDRVWIIGAEQGISPDDKSAIEEERRLCYVAMTRAREELSISARCDKPPSQFIGEAKINMVPYANRPQG